MSKFCTLALVMAMSAGVFSATHVYWYKAATNNYTITANPGPALPSGTVVHEGMVMSATIAQHSGTSEPTFVFGSGSDDQQGRCGICWFKELGDTSGVVTYAKIRAEYRDGWSSAAYCQPGPIHIRCGVAEFMGNVDNWGTVADVPASATWQDALNPLSGTMGFDMNTPTLMAEEVIDIVAPQGRASEVDETVLDKKFFEVDVTDQVNWILAHTGANKGAYSGQYAIACLTSPGEGSTGKINTLSNEECNTTLFWNDAPWTTDGNAFHLVMSFDEGPAVEKGNVRSVIKTAQLNGNPNPFSSSTILSYATGEHKNGVVRVYNAQGKAVYESAVSGIGSLSWNAKGLANGLYVCKLSVGNESLTRRLILMK